jgi:hypothetical protein
LKDKIAMHLDGEAREVARQMLDDSVRFVQELSVWISTHYNEVKSRSGTSEAEYWAHLPLRSHDFSVIGTARSPGRGRHPNGSKATIIWGTLQAHSVMRDMLSDGLAAYPKLSHVLKLHLQDNMVPKSRFAALEDVLIKQDVRMKTLQNSVGKALLKINKRRCSE